MNASSSQSAWYQDMRETAQLDFNKMRLLVTLKLTIEQILLFLCSLYKTMTAQSPSCGFTGGSISIFTDMSNHSWNNDKLLASFSI